MNVQWREDQADVRNLFFECLLTNGYRLLFNQHFDLEGCL